MASRDRQLRTTTAHWTKLSHLLDSFDKCFEACARFDAYRDITPEGRDLEDRQRRAKRATLDSRFNCLRRKVDREIDVCQAERLRLDLDRKMRVRAYQQAYREAHPKMRAAGPEFLWRGSREADARLLQRSA